MACRCAIGAKGARIRRRPKGRRMKKPVGLCRRKVNGRWAFKVCKPRKRHRK